jgi:hypothetical protein
VQKYIVDFAPGLHGHFLEYVLNRYIFGIGSDTDSVFHSSGSAHGINTDLTYQANKQVHRGHFSAFGHQYLSQTEKVVFIKHDPRLDFVLLTNIYYRCHPNAVNQSDFNSQEIEQMQESMMFVGSDAELKNNWYSKLMERHFELTEKVPATDLPVLHFDFGTFFSLDSFLEEINRTAHFLEHTFQFDSSLVDLWHEFVRRNQGLALSRESELLFTQICQGTRAPILNDWKLHAFLNYKISKTFDLHDDPKLFGLDSYPESTRQVHGIIMEHVINFDKRW